jgi:hypothetical protein
MFTCKVCAQLCPVFDGVHVCPHCEHTSCASCVCKCGGGKKRSRVEEDANSSLAVTIPEEECPHCNDDCGDTPVLRSCKTCRGVSCGGCICNCEYYNSKCAPAPKTRSVKSRGLPSGGEGPGETFKCVSDQCKQYHLVHGICFECHLTVNEADAECDTATCQSCDAFFCRKCYPIKQKDVIDGIDGGLFERYCTRCHPDVNAAKRSRR